MISNIKGIVVTLMFLAIPFLVGYWAHTLPKKQKYCTEVYIVSCSGGGWGSRSRCIVETNGKRFVAYASNIQGNMWCEWR